MCPVSQPLARPRKVQRSNRRGQRRTLGFLTAHLRDSYTTHNWSGILQVAAERDINIVTFVGARLRSNQRVAPAQVVFDLIDPAKLDGMVVLSEMLYHFVSMDMLRRFLQRYAPLPMVSIGIVEGIPSVRSDLSLGMRKMVAHLVEVHGYRRLAYLAGPPGEQTSEALFRGYLQGLEEHGIPFDPLLVTPNPTTWGEHIGVEGVGYLLDEKQLRPGVDFHCIIGCGDREGLGAIRALQTRGIRVPDDVAVTGFNNIERAHLAPISLTTVDRRIGRVARRATEMVLALLDGQRVPEREMMAPELVVRRSCGCIPEIVRQASAGTRLSLSRPTRPNGDSAFLNNESAIVAIAAAIEGIADEVPALEETWARQLVGAFLADVTDDSADASSRFLLLLEERLSQEVMAGQRVSIWHDMLSTMRQHIRPHLHTPALVARAEDLWQQARTLVADLAERQQGYRRLKDAEQLQIFNDIAQTLMITFDVDGIMDVLAEGLPRLGIRSCYLSLYENPRRPKEWARLRLAYDELGRIPLEGKGRRFRSCELVPEDCIRSERRRDVVVLALHFHDEQIGFLVIEMGPKDSGFYEALRLQTGTALKGALLAMHNEELYQEALAARRAAEEADRMKSRFLATVSHELRTPLSLIVGTIEMQLREEADSGIPLPDRYRHDLHNIRSSAQHLNRLISDVLDLASSEVGQLRLYRERLSMAEVLAEVMPLGEAMVREKGLQWHVDIPEMLPLVWADRTRIRQVILNLISNAVKFTQDGTVSVWAEVGRDEVLVAVSDTGMGIPSGEQRAIFEDFYQSERTVARGLSGMGLGLAVSRRLIELHGGKIGVLSSGSDGAGATFFFTLPIIAWPDTEGEQEVDRSGTILVLTEKGGDKNPVYQHLVNRGYEVELLRVNESTNWLAEIVKSPPGAVVLDYASVGDHGWELLRDLRENLPTQDIPVVFYSLSEQGDQGGVLELDYLIKPVSSSDLARALRRQGFVLEHPPEGRTILVVDDDPGILELHSRILEKLSPDCQILQARHGAQALELMARRRPDLVLLDLMMPVMDGFQVIQAMQERENLRNVPVVVLTAQALTSQDMARLQQGVAAVLAKGVHTRTEILQQIDAVLGQNKHLNKHTQQVVRRAIAYIHEHYAEPITRSALASHVGLSERYLTYCFRQETGMTPIKYLNRYRIRQARRLLERGDMNVTETAMAVGFADSNYFARIFRDEVGVTPSAYLKGTRPAEG
ncbi:MAG: helix-turn-helix domain-containing protein [Chloroflexi bacterium]|nr:MAG: helix-turn-helix domain-containing protein [Chloroflexota bacterium]